MRVVGTMDVISIILIPLKLNKDIGLMKKYVEFNFYLSGIANRNESSIDSISQ